ncbi:Glutamate receptor 2 [Mactra antiquata]
MECIGYYYLGLLVLIGNNGVFSQAIGDHIYVASVLGPPYLYEDNNGRFQGFVPELLGYLQLNFTITVNDQYGRKLDNGTWTGVMGELIDGDVGMAGILTTTAERSESVDFLYPVHTATPAILLKKPDISKSTVYDRLIRLLHPFELSVWLMSFLSLLVTGTVLYIISHVNPYEWRRMYRDQEAIKREGQSFNCMNSFWFVVSSLMWQGYTRTPRSIGGRIVVTAWWAFIVILLLSYTASLTNYLHSGREIHALNRYAKIKSFKDLAQNDWINVGVLPNGATEASLRSSKIDMYRELYDKVVKARTNDTDPQTMDELIRAVREGSSNYAAILESHIAEYSTHRKPCDLYMIEDDFNLRTASFAVKKGSPLRKHLDSRLMELHDSGDLLRLENLWFKAGIDECGGESIIDTEEYKHVDVTNFTPLDLGTISAVLLILVAGILLGGFVTLIELCIYKLAETNEEDEEELEPINKSSQVDLNSEPRSSLIEPVVTRGGSTTV